ncbi:hypothetical protein BDF21DRAFT_394497 [Thamnidium elegans]|nr:hypothetical protein BDF21DRAFT_394497 [Thamnidium elegans]
MNFFNFNRPVPERRFNIRCQNLLIRFLNEPEWVRHPRALDFIDELAKNDFFRQEVIQTNSALRLNYYYEKWRKFEYPLIAFLLLGISCFYIFLRKDIETFYYIAKKPNFPHTHTFF